MKPNIFKYDKLWKDTYLHPDIRSDEYDLFVDEITTNGIGRDIYWFPAFKPEFCDKIKHIANTQDHWGKVGHSQYRTYDTWLESIGLNDVYNKFLKEYIVPLAMNIYGGISGEMDLMTETENFIAKYPPNHDHSLLPCHVDDSEFTVQVCLNNNDDYIGGGTWFPKQRTLVKVPKGYMTMHPGSLGFRHGARRVLSGTRYQLVSFIKGDDDDDGSKKEENA